MTEKLGDQYITILEKKGFVDEADKFRAFNPTRKNTLLTAVDKIEKAYKKRINELKGTQTTITEIFNSLDLKGCCNLYDIKSRIKDSDSLIAKIMYKYIKAIEKADNGIELGNDIKYLNINKDNYYKIVTDLLGFRIITKFPQEWLKVDEALHITEKNETALFLNTPGKYITDWEKDFNANVDETPFLVEQPQYYHLGKHKQTQAPEEKGYHFIFKDDIENIDSEKFDIQPSMFGYRSIHYLFNYKGHYVELQMRTLLDEAWNECDHDTRYKPARGREQQVAMEMFSKTLSLIVRPATEITAAMYEITNQQEEDVSNFHLDCLNFLASLMNSSGAIINELTDLLKKS